jgi:uncharacterized protein (DUF2147 family)
MINYAKKGALSLLFFLCAAASAASPVGEWLVKDKTAHIRIADCGGKLWGVIGWVDKPGGTDEHNPDVSKRNRSVLGMPILLGMKAKAGGTEWDGDIYDADSGDTYHGNITLKSEDTLHIEGCFLGFLCGGEDWTRIKDAAEIETDEALCRRLSGE